MIETKVKIDANVQEELNKKSKNISISFMLIGTIGLIAYVILSVVIDPTPLWVELFLLFAVFLGIGIVAYFTVKNTNKTAVEKAIEAELTFNEDHYVVKEITNGEETGMRKVFYKDICQVKETKNYLFIRPDKLIQAYHTIDKKLVSEEDLNQIRAYVKKDKNKKENF